MSALREPTNRALRELRDESKDPLIVETTLHPTRRDCLLWLRDESCSTPFDPVFLAVETCDDYRHYLRSDIWREFRDLVINRDESACVVCGHSRRLHVHHRSYRRVGFERNRDVFTLCSGCHELFHGAAR